MKSYFINEAVDKAINDYLISKDNPESILYESFLVVVVRMLINIYGELDIINPYQIKDESAFDNNLMKYGAPQEKIADLKRLLDGFYIIERKNIQSIKQEVNIYFISVQKCLIDLFTFKRLNFGLTENDQKEFFDLLYTPGTSSFLRQSYNYKVAENSYEVAEYYQMSLQLERKSQPVEEKNILGFDVYKLFNLSVADISKMNKQEVDALNSEIYASLDISENAINKDYLLDEKIKMLQARNTPLTTGNGFVDILLIMSVVATSLMVIVIFSTIVF